MVPPNNGFTFNLIKVSMGLLKGYLNHLDYLGASKHKGANGITLQKDYDYFLIIFHFFIWKNFWIKSFANFYLKYI